jgi:Flp pilus assembly protein TadG
LEFALVGPFLIVMLLGICAYGGYFWMSHAVQQVANDAARAALGGLSDTERQSLASASLASEIGSYAYLTPQNASVALASDTSQLTVKISYNAAQTPFWALSSLIPMPPSTIIRQAAVRLGGY